MVVDAASNVTSCVADGDTVLSFQGYDLDMLWFDEIALLCHAVLWLALTYIILRIIKCKNSRSK